MNCQDIIQLLDASDVAAISKAERAAVELHIAECAHCSGDWSIHEQVSAHRIPVMPDTLALWRPDPVAGTGARRFRGRRRHIVPVLLLGGAAAAMFALESLQYGDEFESPLEAADRAMQSPEVAANSKAADASGSRSPDSVGSADTATLGLLRHTLLVLPTTYETATQSSIAAADGVYRAMLRFLQAQPNLDIIPVTEVELAEAQTAAAALDLSGMPEARAIDRRNREIRRQLGSDNTMHVLSRGRADGSPFWTVQISHTRANGGGMIGSSGPTDEDLDAIGEQLARRSYARLFPDADVGRPIVDIADTTRSDEDRLFAIQSFMMESVLFDRRGGQEADPYMVPTVDAATEFARSAADSNARRRAWEYIGQLSHPSVVQPMTEALLYDDDPGVRDAVTVALSHYRDDPVVRAALESTALTDPSLRVRVQARLSLLTDDERYSYVNTALLNTTLTPDDRLAPLVVARSTPTRVGTASERPEIPPVLPAALNAIASMVKAVESEDFREAGLIELALGDQEEFVELMQNEPVATVRRRVIGELRSRDFTRGEMIGIFEQLLEFETDERALFYINRHLFPEETGPPGLRGPNRSNP